jgi:hypothetical protein
VAALGTDDLRELLLHELGHDAQPDAHREGEQALAGGPTSSPSASCTRSGSGASSVVAPVATGTVPFTAFLLRSGENRRRTLAAPADGAGGPPDRRPQVLRATGQPPSAD